MEIHHNASLNLQNQQNLTSRPFVFNLSVKEAADVWSILMEIIFITTHVHCSCTPFATVKPAI